MTWDRGGLTRGVRTGSLQSHHGGHTTQFAPDPDRTVAMMKDRITTRARRCIVHVAGIAAVAVGMASCSQTTGVEPAPVDYVGALQSICADTAAQLEALPDPPTAITATDFATQASSILRDEAERLRELDAPDDLD